jgi:hypothetical protein
VSGRNIVLLQPQRSSKRKSKPNGNASQEQWHVVEVPRQLSFLSVRGGAIRCTKRKPRSGPYVAAVPAQSATSAVLGLFAPNGATISVNGVPSPKVAVLYERDELLLSGASDVCFVTLSTATRISRIVKKKIGSVCPVCCQGFAKDDIVYVCVCGFTLHAGKTDIGDKGPGCADMLRRCLDCDRPIAQALAESFSYVPEGVLS